MKEVEKKKKNIILEGQRRRKIMQIIKRCIKYINSSEANFHSPLSSSEEYPAVEKKVKGSKKFWYNIYLWVYMCDVKRIGIIN